MATKIKRIQISDEVRALLGECRASGNSLFLPQRQLDRALYADYDKVIKKLGGKWSRAHGAHVLPTSAEEALATLLSEEAPVDVKKTYQVFGTPPAVAARMVQTLGLPKNAPSMFRVLEPSAGDGALVDAVRAVSDATVICVEIRPDAAVFRRTDCTAHVADFLTWRTTDISDADRFMAIVMNPPFANDQDIDHVRHAFYLLRPGGRLAAIMSPGFTFGTTQKRKEFKAFLSLVGGAVTQFDEGTFKESGTNVRTLLVTLRKPL